jgi:phospholipase C
MAYVDDIVASLGWMLGNGTLPQVTIIVGPEELSEHATWHPSEC